MCVHVHVHVCAIFLILSIHHLQVAAAPCTVVMHISRAAQTLHQMSGEHLDVQCDIVPMALFTTVQQKYATNQTPATATMYVYCLLAYM